VNGLVSITFERTLDGPCVVLRIFDADTADAYAETLNERSRLAHGRTDMGFADDCAEVERCARLLRAADGGAS